MIEEVKIEGTFLPQLKLSFFLHSAVGSIVAEAAHAGAAVPFTGLTGFTTAYIVLLYSSYSSPSRFH